MRTIERTSIRRGQGIPSLRGRPKGFALWTPTTFEKVDETFISAPRPFLIHILT